MDLAKLGVELLQSKLGGQVQSNSAQDGLSALLGKGDGGFDIASLVQKFSGDGGLQALAASWLGDGGNLPISADKIKDLFGENQIAEFASKLGIGQEDAADGLADVLPQLVDKASSGGSLLDQFGGIGGLADMAKKLF